MKNCGLLPFIAGLVLLLPAAIFAQEGHPYNGTWRGDISLGAETKAVLLIMNYDGENITGMINPGRNSFPILSADHEAAAWRLTVKAQNRAGEAISFTGVMSETGSPNRIIDGTWNQDGQVYTLHLARE